jgi:hypothetical protein
MHEHGPVCLWLKMVVQGTQKLSEVLRPPCSQGWLIKWTVNKCAAVII